MNALRENIRHVTKCYLGVNDDGIMSMTTCVFDLGQIDLSSRELKDLVTKDRQSPLRFVSIDQNTGQLQVDQANFDREQQLAQSGGPKDQISLTNIELVSRILKEHCIEQKLEFDPRQDIKNEKLSPEDDIDGQSYLPTCLMQ